MSANAPRKGTLRARIVAAFALLALGIVTFFAGVGYHTANKVESHLIQRRLESLAQWQLQRLQAGQPAALPPGLALYLGPQVPAALRALPAGFHDVHAAPTDQDVVIGTTADGQPYALVDEESDFETIEDELVLRLVLGGAAALLLAALLGWAIAGRVIAPLTALADAVRHGRLGGDVPALSRNDEIGVLGRALAEHTAELARFLERERLFTGDVSHELRTPLTVILGAAEVLAAQCGDRAELRAPLERLRRTAQDTAERVGALLLLSRAPQRLEAPRLALAPLVEREIERCRPLLSGRGVALRFERRDDVQVFAPPELVGMAVGNLLRNACQYTEQGGITVRLEPGLLCIEDTGPGLPPTVHAQLFERFVRGTPGSGGGVGLGLAIVKRIVEHLGWRIELGPSAGGGSRFLLRFPARE